VTGVNAGPFGEISGVGATAADAPLAIANDIPAAPQAGKAILERFLLEARFACAIFKSSLASSEQTLRLVISLTHNTLPCFPVPA
jgi:hypothetical protein